MAPPAMTRRTFLMQVGLGAGALLPASVQAAIDNLEPLKITRIDAVTFRKGMRIGGGSGGSDAAEFWWVRLHTDKGIIGTGETYPFHQGEIGALKDHSRQHPRPRPSGHRRHVAAVSTTPWPCATPAAPTCAILSAINMAQLDILGQASGPAALPPARGQDPAARPRLQHDDRLLGDQRT